MTTAAATARSRDDDVRPSAEPGLFRAVMRHHAKGVAVITAGVETPTGFCATSLVSVSLEPPLVAFTVGLHAASLVTVKTARHVMVHLLAADQEDIARRFAQPGAARFGPRTRWHRGAFGLPVIDGVLAWMLLVPVSYLSAGDHVLVIGRVIMVRHVTDGGPLIHHNGDFARLAALDRSQEPGRNRKVRRDNACDGSNAFRALNSARTQAM